MNVKKRLKLVPIELLIPQNSHNLGDRVYVPSMDAHGTIYGIEFLPEQADSKVLDEWWDKKSSNLPNGWWYKVRMDEVDKTIFANYYLPESKLIAYSTLPEWM